MNILYFASTDFNEFKTSFKKHWKEVYENCIKLSSLLIYEIIRPKRILCLGINNCFRPLNGEQTEEIKELIKGSLYSTKKSGFSICGMTHPSARTSNLLRENIGWHLYTEWFNKAIINSLTNKVVLIKQILSDISTKHSIRLEFEESQLSQRFGCFKFHFQNEIEICLLFEFQKSFYSDLRYGLYNSNRKLYSAEKCIPPFDNWMNLEESFNQEDFKIYFDTIISTLISIL